jgi:hypothetical protein
LWNKVPEVENIDSDRPVPLLLIREGVRAPAGGISPLFSFKMGLKLRQILGKKFKAVEKENLWKIVQWGSLGRMDEGSPFFQFPVEVAF